MKKRKRKGTEAGKFVLALSNGLIRLFFDVLFYVVVIMSVLKACDYSYNFCYRLFGSVSVSNEAEMKEVEFYIETGDSTKEVSKKLENLNLIVDDTTFYLKTKLLKVNLLPGTYLLNTNMDYQEILNIISNLSIVNDPQQIEVSGTPTPTKAPSEAQEDD